MTSSPGVGADGNIYVGSLDENVYSLHPDGTQKWRFATGLVGNSSPAVGADGTIYIGSEDGNVYALKGGAHRTAEAAHLVADGAGVVVAPLPCVMNRKAGAAWRWTVVISPSRKY